MQPANSITQGTVSEPVRRYIDRMAQVMKGYIGRKYPGITEPRFYVVARRVRESMEGLVQDQGTIQELMKDPTPEGLARLLTKKIEEGSVEGDLDLLNQMFALDAEVPPEERVEVQIAFSTQHECIAPALWQAMQEMKKQE